MEQTVQNQSAQNVYLNYQAMVTQANVSMATLERVCERLSLEERVKALEDLREKMKNQVFSVGIMGEFRRGKSTVINALLRKEIVPSDIVPTSATLNYIRWDVTPRAVVHFKDGTEKNIGIEELSAYVTKITAESERMAEKVEKAVVSYPCEFCRNGVQIIDTPGLNDDERMTAISEQVIPTLDAIIMVLVPDSPFSATEADFVRTKVMTSDLGRIIFVVNKIDTVDEEDRPRLLNAIKEKIQTSVLDKIASMYGKSSEEYKEAELKVSGIHIYGVSARNALKGYLKGDADKVKQSGIKDFEDALSHLLTVERGMLSLMGPVNSVLSVAKDARKSIALRRDATQLDEEELKRITAESEKALEDSREQKMNEVSALKNKASALYKVLEPSVTDIYNEISRQLTDYVDQVPILPNDVKDNAAVERKGTELTESMNVQLKQCLSEGTEKLLIRVQEEVGNDLLALQNISTEIQDRLNSVQKQISPHKNDKAFDWGVVAADTLIPIVGIGGFISGWKENGLPGALVGGGVGLAAGGAAYYGTLLFCGTVLGLSSVAALPVFFIAGLASTFGGRAAVRSFFGKKVGEKNIVKLREELRVSVTKAMKDIQEQRVLEKWLDDTTKQVYDSVANEVDKEIEATLISFAETLKQLNLDRQKKENDFSAVLQDMDELDELLDEAAKTIEPVKAKLVEALGTSIGA